MTPEERSKIINLAATLIRNGFDDITDLDLPKKFGKKRYIKLRGRINNHNDYLRRMAIELKKTTE